MILFLAGDIHGRVSSLYERVFELEHKLGVRADCVLQTGNFGIWPDPLRLDRATKQRCVHPDFPHYYYNDDPVPRQTLFVAGKHEDHQWMNVKRGRGEMEILPNLNWLLNGYKTFIGSEEMAVSLVGMGKVYSPVSYRSHKVPDKKTRGHYRQSDIELACKHATADILLTHQAPKGVKIGSHLSDSEGLDKVCSTLNPKLMVHGHYNHSEVYLYNSIQVVSLAYQEVSVWNYDGAKFTKLA